MTFSPEQKRTIIVTGSSRGLGREIAIKFGKTGNRIAVTYLTREGEAAAVAEDIVRAGGESLLFHLDVRKTRDVDAMMDEIARQWGTVDVLVNNAGMTRDGLLLRMTEQDWDNVIETNLAGPFHCIRAVSSIMSKQRQGHIINISSIVGVQGREGQANYASSKAGLIGLTRTCAQELGRFNVKVNAVLPGYISTEMGDAISDAMRDRILNENALARVSDPREVAEFIYHLSSMDNVSGQVFNLDSRVL